MVFLSRIVGILSRIVGILSRIVGILSRIVDIDKQRILWEMYRYFLGNY